MCKGPMPRGNLTKGPCCDAKKKYQCAIKVPWWHAANMPRCCKSVKGPCFKGPKVPCSKHKMVSFWIGADGPCCKCAKASWCKVMDIFKIPNQCQVDTIYLVFLKHYLKTLASPTGAPTLLKNVAGLASLHLHVLQFEAFQGCVLH